ncbi:DUF1007 family protein [Maridesulfovibrio bastinii]|uniref:DUF1007 family protein n=1 Tax=Maridesulfovibrio bastinii TaxID=47157 RepID=UPI000482B882|nr:DUF1007 family protein [Maridesulfovibrio bastinii]
MPQKLNLLIFLLSLLISFFSPVKSYAHPHVFVDCQLTFVFNDKGLAGINEDWIFDEMFGSMVLGEHDKNNDLKISPAEEKSIYNGAFINLKNFDYFTHLNLDGKHISVATAEKFKAFVKEGLLHYNFFIPCEIKFSAKKHRLLTAIYDKTYYTAILLAENNKIKGLKDSKKVSLDFNQLEELSYYYGQVVPDGAILTINP